jgi:hypothetical protein
MPIPLDMHHARPPNLESSALAEHLKPKTEYVCVVDSQQDPLDSLPGHVTYNKTPFSIQYKDIKDQSPSAITRFTTGIRKYLESVSPRIKIKGVTIEFKRILSEEKLIKFTFSF